MDFNVYYMQVQADQLLREARAAAARRALLGPPPPVVGPAVRRAIDWMRSFYARWSSAASTGSKPITARAWSRSR
ncbi:MAG: hypothetical protein FJZ38_19070 [Candidatus Rokubacteria bacterium]|nr:hypothetical protein [Candidatus Rokubacteria bacterium]